MSLFVGMCHKGVMLLGRNTRQWLEPVRVMCRAVFHRPVLHCLCHYVSGCQRQLAPLLHNPLHFLEHASGKAFFHFSDSKYLTGEQLFNI